jgi:hypothetical protein
MIAATNTANSSKPQMLVCDICNKHGHIMYIYLNEYVDSHNRNQVTKRIYNYYSRTRHYNMNMSTGKDFGP